MRGSAAGRRRSPQPGRAAHRSMGDERERVRYMRRCGPRGADRRGGRGCVPGQPAGLREVVRGAPLRQGRPKGAGEPQAPVGCRGYPHARLCRRATKVAAAREGCTSEHGRRAGASTLHAEMRSAWSRPKRGPGMRPRAARRAAGGSKGCSPTPGPPKGGGGAAGSRGVQGVSPCAALPLGDGSRRSRRGCASEQRHERERMDARGDAVRVEQTGCWQGVWGIAGGGGSPRGREREGLPLASPMR